MPVVSNLYDFVSSVKHKANSSECDYEECLRVQNYTGIIRLLLTTGFEQHEGEKIMREFANCSFKCA